MRYAVRNLYLLMRTVRNRRRAADTAPVRTVRPQKLQPGKNFAACSAKTAVLACRKEEILSAGKNSFYAYMSRLKYIRRWGLMRSVEPENVAEHTFQVAIIAHALCLMHNEKAGEKISEQDVVLCALYHETAEAITGDLPTPIKYYNEEIACAYKGIEQEAEQSMLGMLPESLRARIEPYVTGDVDPEARKIVKAADRICAYIKCIEERKSGNAEFDKAAPKIRASIEAMHMPEVDAFLESFLEAYEKTLDELNS